MALTAPQAIGQLDGITTIDQLRNLINQLSIDASGKTTVLYSGVTANGVDNSSLIQGMLRNGDDIRVIDNTEAAKFLQLNDKLPGYNQALADKFRALGLGDKPMDPGTPANKFLFGDVDANGTRMPNGAWDNISSRFVDATVGEVRTLTGGAKADGVFGQTEVPAALKNANITTIDGIPRADLETCGVTDAYKTISARSDVYSAQVKVAVVANGNILRGADEQPRIDSRAYFEPTGLQGKAPLIENASYKNLAEYMPNRLSQHETGARISQEIADKYRSLANTPDLPGVDNAALPASAKTTLDKLGWAGDLLALGLIATAANAAYAQGDKAGGDKIVRDWGIDFAGGLAGGLLAAKLTGAALASFYLTGPAGIVIAGGLTLIAGFAGSVLGSLGFEALLNSWTSDFGGAESTTSPLVLDLNGDGVQTTRLSNSFTQGVHFNLDATGLAENTAWVDAQDGLLVRDLNADGQISSGRELFGNHTLLHNGARAANGFEALAELDDNADGVVDANDALFASLKVWKDTNSDGVTDTGELLTLAQAGVKSFNVSYTSSDSADANGNQHLQQGSFTTTDDSTQSMNDVWFKVDTARTQDTDMLSVSDEIADLPDLANIGSLRSLRQAMVRDDSGQLQTLVQQYEAQALGANRDALLQDILFHWAGVQDLDPASRTARHYGNAIGDARKLAFLEAVLGRGYEGTWCWGERDPNPHGPAAAKLLVLYEQVKTFYGAQLDAQTVCREDLAAPSVNFSISVPASNYRTLRDTDNVMRPKHSANTPMWKEAA